MSDQKYTVQKADGEELEPDTFFVIRSGDMFGIAGLYAYANQLQSILELAQTRPILTPAEQEHVTGIADYVADLARQWQSRQTKIPD